MTCNDLIKDLIPTDKLPKLEMGSGGGRCVQYRLTVVTCILIAVQLDLVAAFIEGAGMAFGVFP